MNLSVRKIVISGILGAIAILLGVTRLGFIPVPNVAGNATIMHVPAILGGVLEGPVVGILVGAIFGIFSFLNADNPLFADPLVSVLPRLFIGLVAYLVFAALRRVNLYLAWGAAGLFGTLTNTTLVLSMAVFRGYIPPAVIVTIIPQAIAEMIIAIVLTIAIARGVNLFQGGKGTQFTGKDDL
ncbi:MAG: ECF transporter S component [Bacillota bacterium]